MFDKNSLENKYKQFTSIKRSQFYDPEKIVMSFIKFYEEYFQFKVDHLGSSYSPGLQVITDYCSGIGNKELATKLFVKYEELSNSEQVINKTKTANRQKWSTIYLIEKFEKIFSFLGFLLALFFEYLIRSTILKEFPFTNYNPLIGAAIIWYLGLVFLEDYPERVHNYIWWKLFDVVSREVKNTITSFDELYEKESRRLILVAENLINTSI